MCRPFRAPHLVLAVPRALPWAGLFRAFGPLAYHGLFSSSGPLALLRCMAPSHLQDLWRSCDIWLLLIFRTFGPWMTLSISAASASSCSSLFACHAPQPGRVTVTGLRYCLRSLAFWWDWRLHAPVFPSFAPRYHSQTSRVNQDVGS